MCGGIMDIPGETPVTATCTVGRSSMLRWAPGLCQPQPSRTSRGLPNLGPGSLCGLLWGTFFYVAANTVPCFVCHTQSKHLFLSPSHCTVHWVGASWHLLVQSWLHLGLRGGRNLLSTSSLLSLLMLGQKSALHQSRW